MLQVPEGREGDQVMKILHTADWHLGQFKGPVENGVNMRSLDTVKCLDYMVEVARRERPDLVCVSGDIFHQEQIGPARYSDEMIEAVRIIGGLAEHAKYVVVMRGTPNHDGEGQFRVLTKIMENNKKVSVVTVPQIISTPVADIACIPGFDKQEFRSRFPGLSAEEENLTWTQYISDMVIGLRAQCRKGVPAILMAHYTVPGCNTESGQTSFFANFEPVIPGEALEAAGYDLVALGHIHRPQELPGHDWYYSGAINAMNFNDEGQERGFWIHHFEEGAFGLDGMVFTDSEFVKTPYREFCTIAWEKEDVEEYLRDGKLYLFGTGVNEAISDCMVRLKYSCTSEQRKQLNIPLLQKDLYECGAFYVADIEAESTVDITNRGLLSEESDPILNLKKWLDEKCFKDSDKIVDLAEPIIAAAVKESPTAEIHGVFKPVSISVKNYRNYKEEHFDFSDVSFCTINGVNGAGKSSLFMDAIVDCLFEETREGDNKAWIRGTEDARSGSIEFIFDIGADRFRVVRTRTKSGKPTLNLSQLGDGNEWLNLSRERITDTQAEIEKLLGMDSMTFRSCALIMQDQYGLFLQAKKDERIAILGNLLGLGIYSAMELDARRRLGDAKRELMQKKEAARIKTEFVESKGNPAGDLEHVQGRIGELQEKEIEVREARRQKENELTLYTAEVDRRNSLAAAMKELEQKKAETERQTAAVQGTISSCNKLLAGADLIHAKADECKGAAGQAAALAKDVAVYESEKRALADLNEQIQRYQNIIDNCSLRNARIEAELEQASDHSAEDIGRKLLELDSAKKALAEMQDRRYMAASVDQEIYEKQTKHRARMADLESSLKLAEADLKVYRQQKETMDNSGCPDIANASCRFLQKAVADAAKIADTEAGIKIYRQAIEEQELEFEKWKEGKEQAKAEIGYSDAELQRLHNLVLELGVYEKKKEEMEARKLSEARLEAEKESNDKTIVQCRESLSVVTLKASEATLSVGRYADAAEKYREAKTLQDSLAGYLTQEQQLPVYEERLNNANEKLEDLREALEETDGKLLATTAEMVEADRRLDAMNSHAAEQVAAAEKTLRTLSDEISELQVEKGTLLQKVNDVKKMLEEIGDLKRGITEVANLAGRYEALKQAFSKDGVPHQIIRNIIPHITNAANNILGAMTGGTMGVEFVMEKAVKGKDGDKATLDVLINEYGKTTLPYASKSGGEKVKASLAVILALAEIKTTAAGIQLGMLFIDEPPFLDEDGTQAYVDSLETIRQRYPDVKVMAITHDEAMKARFTQAVTVIKTEEGSKVIY